MHQGWPKFTQHLWYATPDNGIAAIVYSPSEVTANVGDNVPVVISEDTYYPMDHQITFTIKEVRNKVKDPYFIEEIEEIMKDFRAYREEVSNTKIPD